MSGNTINLLSGFLDASSLRHQVHSNNIANINTPNYKRQVVSFEDEMNRALNSQSKRITLYNTNPNHFPKINNQIKPMVLNDEENSLRTDGNNVDIDMELALLAENTIKFNVLTQSISKQFGLLNSVIKGGR